MVRRFAHAALSGALALLAPGLAGAQITTRASVAAGGGQANFPSGAPAITADGRWVAFYSGADNLVAGDTNGGVDVFVYDRQTGTTTRVNLGPGGVQANSRTLFFGNPPAISADGRWVAFVSEATNLVPGDTNGVPDVFVHDRQTGRTTRVSVGPGGAQAALSDFYSVTSPASISADGRFVAFDSPASNLVAGDTNTRSDVFVHDVQTGTTTRVSVASGGAQANDHSIGGAISADGRWVAFQSAASNLVAGDTNSIDVFVHDRQTGMTSRVSVGPAGAQADADSSQPAISADGRWVAFASNATNLVVEGTNAVTNVFVHDRQTGTTSRVSIGPGGVQGNAVSRTPSISADGRMVAFYSAASTLVTDDTNGKADTFVHDRQTGTTTRMSVSSGGAQANDDSQFAAISADGRWVAFQSVATNLIVGDTNGSPDVFLRDAGDAACAVTVAPTATSFGQPGGSGSVAVTTGTGCAWTAVSNAPSWLAVTSGTSGTGTGSVSYAAAANLTSSARTGTLTVGGQWFTVTQVGVCSYQLLKTTIVPAAGGPRTLTVTTGSWCAWTAASNDPDWLTVTHGTSGIGNGTVSYTVAAKFTDGTRRGTLTVAGQTLTVDQVAATSRTTLASVGPGGVQGNNDSAGGCPNHHITEYCQPAISGDGRWVAFASLASNLVTGDTNGTTDVFVRDRQTGATTRVSVGPGGAQGNSGSGLPAISADGRFVAFYSGASNLVAGDTNGTSDVFVHDRQTGTTTRVSVGPGGTQAEAYTGFFPDSSSPSLSADGRWVAFLSGAGNLKPGDANGVVDVFVHDRQTGTTTRVSEGPGGADGNNYSGAPAISADGRWVAFYSWAGNLVAGDTNGRADVFVRDMQAGTTTRVSVGLASAEANNSSEFPAISADGRWVAFESYATNLVAGDTPGVDVFVYDRETTTTTRVSVGPGGVEANRESFGAAISADGRLVAFNSQANNLAQYDFNGAGDVFVHDRQTGVTTWVSVSGAAQFGGGSGGASLSADGRWVAFTSANPTVVPGASFVSGVIVYDRLDAPRIFLSGELAFGNLRAGTTIARGLAIVNDGNSPLTVTGISYPPGFSGAWSGTVLPGEWHAVNVIFAPAALASYGGTVTVNANQVSGTNTIAVSGTGIVQPSRHILLSGNLAFGNVPAGSTATRTLTIKNGGTDVMTVVGLAYPPGFSGAWSGTLAGGASRDVTVTFAPTALTTYGGPVIVYADQISGTNTIAVTGTGGAAAAPTMSVDRTSLQFGATSTGTAFTSRTLGQTVRLTQQGAGSVSWTATPSQPWISISPSSGSGSATLTVTVSFSQSLPLSGAASGTIAFAVTGAGNTPGPVTVGLAIIANGTSVGARGSFDTPVNGSTGVTGSIAVTGWSLDDVDVTRVRIVRDPVPGEGSAQIFIGTAVFVDGSRTDVAALNPNVPRNTRAGWGYLLLTNFLPNQGNGTFTLYAYADDADGHTTLLGSRTITCTNSSATRPFGAIDTPAQGEVISGSSYNNFGWVLARAPALAYPPNGTVRVVIDGVILPAAPAGWVGRSDLTALFPASTYPGVAHALGVASIDTTTLADGVHTIAWVVTADNGQADGIGSRFFTVVNGSGLRTSVASGFSRNTPAGEILDSAIAGRRGWDENRPLQTYRADDEGRFTIDAEELDRIELHVGAGTAGYLRVGDQLGALPIGSYLDPVTGVFTWAPGAGFVHSYDFVFVRSERRRDVRIVLHPKVSSRVGPQVVIDRPKSRDASDLVVQPFDVAGWAIDRDATIGTGVDTLHVWAYPVTGAAPIFLGAAAYGGARPDVAAIFGSRFEGSGYGLSVGDLPPGTYDLAVFAWSTARASFAPAKVVRITVR